MELRKADIRNVLDNPLVFKDVTGYEGLYKISYNGIVYSKISNKILAPGISNGYCSVVLYRGKEQKKTHTLHVLVATEWIPNPNNKKCVNHKHGIKTNNHKDHLEWSTHSENNSHAIQTGLKKPVNPAKGLIQIDLKGNVVKTYKSTIEAEKEGFRSGCIALVCSGKRNTHLGFKWEYINQ